MKIITTTDKNEMFDRMGECDLFLTTTNSCLDSAGHLVMGAGHALQVKERWAGIEQKLGAVIQSISLNAALAAGEQGYKLYEDDATKHWSVHEGCWCYGVYGLIVSPAWPKAKLGAFQTKTKYWEVASKRAIFSASLSLAEWCDSHPKAKVFMPFPGIGEGGLSKGEVLPVIKQLPDSVTVWELK